MSVGTFGPGNIAVPFPIFKLPPAGMARVIMVVESWASVWTHYYGQKTVRCPGTAICRLCEEGQELRFQAYILAKGWTDDKVCLVHLTAMACAQIEEWTEFVPKQAGLRMVLTRKKLKVNGPVDAICYGYDDNVNIRPWKQLADIVEKIYKKNGMAPHRK